MIKSMEELMTETGPYHDLLDEIARTAHGTYMAYEPKYRVEHDARTQANCIYSHLVAEADRRLLDDKNILAKEIRGLRVWIFKVQDVVLRFKKMDEAGLSQNIQTKQQKKYDAGHELPGLPAPPIRLTVGYLLDRTGSQYVRTQIARPIGADVEWCAAIVPAGQREEGAASWADVTRQKRVA